MSEVFKTIVCPLWDVSDHRFQARHYKAWTRKCCRCGRNVAVADSLRQQADSEEVRFLCEQCDLVQKSG